MTNQYYNATGNPQYLSRDSSSLMQQEFNLINAGFNLLPAPTLIPNFGTDSGAANAYHVTIGTSPAAYTAGMVVTFFAGNANTGNSTLQVNSLGAVQLLDVNGNQLPAGAIEAGAACSAVYDGTHFRLGSANGVFNVPTPAAGDNSNKIATTAFVQSAAFNSALPNQTGNAGLFVTTNGSVASWASPLPSQTGQSGNYLTTNGTTASWAAVNTVYNGYIYGFTLSNDVTSPNTVVDVAAGMCADSTNAVMITGTAGTVNFATTGANGLDIGAQAASTWYAILVINGTSGTAYLATKQTAGSAISPTLPAGYTKYRYIGSVWSNASTHIDPFIQQGNKFWNSAADNQGVTDLNGGTATTPTLFTVSCPPSVQVFPIMDMQINPGTSTAGVDLAVWSPTIGATLTTYMAAVGYLASTAANLINGNCLALTNTSGQLYYQVALSGATGYVKTFGWIDPHIASTF